MIEHRSARSAAMKAYNHLSFQGVISRRRGIRRSSDAERLTSQRVQAAGSHRGRGSVRGVARDDRLWAGLLLTHRRRQVPEQKWQALLGPRPQRIPRVRTIRCRPEELDLTDVRRGGQRRTHC